VDPARIADFLLGRVPLFASFSRERIQEVVSVSLEASFEPRETIVAFGSPGLFLGVLLEGGAQVSLVDDLGERTILARLGEGDIFGEMSLLTGDRTAADVVAESLCRVLLIPEAVATSLVAASHRAAKVLSRLVVERTGANAALLDAVCRRERVWRAGSDPCDLALVSEVPLRILVVNCGSSSLKYHLFDTGDPSRTARGVVERIGITGTRHTHWARGRTVTRDLPAGGHREAFGAMVEGLTGEEAGVIFAADEIGCVGHRVVHGGRRFTTAQVLEDAVLEELRRLAPLAPLHNPVSLTGIEAARDHFPGAVHVAVFDTSFHSTLPPTAYLYGLPLEFALEEGIRRYGFHGMSHSYVGLRAAEHLRRPFGSLGLVSCHLGNGSSLCTIDHGRSVDTTMGFTPSGGLVMGTRSGDLDPSVLVHLIRTRGLTAGDLEDLVNRESGLKGLSGRTSDLRALEEAAEAGEHRSLLALKVYCHRVRREVGAAMATLGGVDALIFTGGIGEGSARVRNMVCQGLGFMGLELDPERNRSVSRPDRVVDIARDGSPARILVIPTNEELMIARESLRAMQRTHIDGILGEGGAPVPIRISETHVHLSPDHVAALFGPGHRLAPRPEPAAQGTGAGETVTLVGPQGTVEGVPVRGPARDRSQVEVAMAEQFRLGIHPPARESGDLEGTPGLALRGPAGTATLLKGAICALRHLHLSPEDAARLGLRDGYRVLVRVDGEPAAVLGDVLVRVRADYRPVLELDADEARTACVGADSRAFIVGVQSRG
jgi:acetate kinase